MQILLNDKLTECDENITVTMLLEQIKQFKKGIAIALNGKILPREQWKFQKLQNDDQILLFEVIVGG